MNKNLFAYEVKPYGHYDSHDTCMLYKQDDVQKFIEEKKNPKRTPDILMVGLFLIGLTMAFTHKSDVAIQTNKDITNDSKIEIESIKHEQELQQKNANQLTQAH